MNTKQLIGIVVLAAAGQAMALPAIDSDLQDLPFVPTLSRSEVIADLNLWKRAGMDRFAGRDDFDPLAADYLRAQAQYQRLRNGPEYLAEVRLVAGRRNETAAVLNAAPATH
jgi:hypothetical protein